MRPLTADTAQLDSLDVGAIRRTLTAETLGRHVYVFGEVTSTKQFSDGSSISKTYNKYGDVLTSTDELGHTTSFTYDDYGRVLTTTDPLGHTTTNSYVPTGATSDAQVCHSKPGTPASAMVGTFGRSGERFAPGTPSARTRPALM